MAAGMLRTRALACNSNGPSRRSSPTSRRASPPGEAVRVDEPDGAAVGSNAWLVDATRTARGVAILAGDPHLGYSMPNIWRRVRLVWPGGEATGVNTPGFPGVVIGASGRLAWSFTNTTGDL